MLWSKLKDAIDSVVDNITIADLAEHDSINFNDIIMGANI